MLYRIQVFIGIVLVSVIISPKISGSLFSAEKIFTILHLNRQKHNSKLIKSQQHAGMNNGGYHFCLNVEHKCNTSPFVELHLSFVFAHTHCNSLLPEDFLPAHGPFDAIVRW